MELTKLYDLFWKCMTIRYTSVENDGDFAIEYNDIDKITIYFEGSVSATDWKNNFAFFTKPYKRMEHTWYCHRGFLKVWKSIEPCLEPIIMNTEIKDITIVGFSHGAALAQLCYEYVKFHRPEIQTQGIGFGAPRVFWGPVSQEVRERFKDFLVVRQGKDIVSRMPPALFGFKHLGKIIKIGKTKGALKDHHYSSYAAALLALKEGQNGAENN